MTRRTKLVSLTAVAMLAGLLVAGNVQYMFLSTYRVKNDSGPEIVRVHLTLDSSSGLQDLGVVSVRRDSARTGWIRLRGEGSLQVRAQGRSEPHTSCATYVEGRHYHVDVDIDGAGRVHCEGRLVTLSGLGLLNVIPWSVAVSNKGMQLTKPAQAMELRSWSPVLGGLLSEGWVSQFIIVWGEPPSLNHLRDVRLVPVADAHEYVRRAAAHIIGASETGAWQVVDATGDTAADLVGEAMDARIAGVGFETTQFSRFLDGLSPEMSPRTSIALWGGGGWDDLPPFEDWAAFVEHARKESTAGADEIYATVRRAGGGSRGAA